MKLIYKALIAIIDYITGEDMSIARLKKIRDELVGLYNKS